MYNNRYRSFNKSKMGSFGKRTFGGRRRNYANQFGLDASLFVKKATFDPQDELTYTPHNSFSDFAISTPLKNNILGKGYTEPTPIQDQAIEPILEGRDLIGLANTGTGKTAAFLIPIIDQIFRNRNKQALIIAPTRELAVQINQELRSFSHGMRIYSALIIGGTNAQRQIHDLRRNPNVVIGTPGRLRDLIERRVLHLEDFSIFVLDEVDLMVDIGFIDDVKYFCTLLPKERQSLFFSATISPKIRLVLDIFVNDPVTVSVKKQDTSENVDQDVIKVISREKKVDQLHDVLIKDGFEKVLVFGRTKHSVDNLYKELVYRGFKAGAIHGNKSQGQRMRVLESFKQNEIQILLATDVASRGLDIPDVTHVINYEMPESYGDYIHRIGRTGRANKKGMALTFID
ncbi:MAG TPA: DEAD/DEAH box helicase [Patescibacteria group bacterium]|nr:DEAD/DEAH box helicase [Patescibacteria group bacterium]